jgi:hypothetical protein
MQRLTVPSGFTVTIGSVLAFSIGRHGYPGLLDVWLFATAIGLGFCLLGFCLLGFASGLSRSRDLRTSLPDGAAVYNLVPVIVVPAVYLATSWIADAAWAFCLAGFLAVMLYVCVYSAFAQVTIARRDSTDCSVAAGRAPN